MTRKMVRIKNSKNLKSSFVGKDEREGDYFQIMIERRFITFKY